MGSETILTKKDRLCFKASEVFFSIALSTSSFSFSSLSSSLEDLRISVAKSEMIFQAISRNDHPVFLSIDREKVIINCYRAEKYVERDKEGRI